MQSRRWHRHWRLTALGAVLCLLAAIFAIEAKIGWYSPDGSVRVEFSSTKLQAADAPKLIAQALAPTGTLPHVIAEATLLLAISALMLVAFIPRRQPALHLRARAPFFPPQFFRPPPHS
jgi:hypothetical protein